jgi:hypothetical protein
MFARYVMKLKELHLSLGNPCEAAHALLMQASYPWAAAEVGAHPPHPESV